MSKPWDGLCRWGPCMYGHIRKHDTTIPYIIGLAYLATIHHASGYLGRLLDAH